MATGATATTGGAVPDEPGAHRVTRPAGPVESDRAGGTVRAPGTVGTVGSGQATRRPRQLLARILAVAGLLAYSWWILVPLKHGLMTSPDELFSNLEITGQPYAAVMQHADLVSGVLLLAAFLAAGHRRIAASRGDWLAMMVFALAGTAGGIFPEVCADGINAVCRQQELHFQLPLNQYLHMGAGVVEFAAITTALVLAIRRTRGSHARAARLYNWLGLAALACYPLLGLAYLVNRMGGVMEAVFFTGFTVMVATQIAERTARRYRGPAAPPAAKRQQLSGCGAS
jgi:Protein of unknown function (DUF998)